MNRIRGAEYRGVWEYAALQRILDFMISVKMTRSSSGRPWTPGRISG